MTTETHHNALRQQSDTSMGRALRAELETDAYATVHAIDALRLAVLAASTDLVDALADLRDALADLRDALADLRDARAGTDEAAQFMDGHCGGASARSTTSTSRAPREDAEKAEEQDAAAVEQVMAATKIRQFLADIADYPTRTDVGWMNVAPLIAMAHAAVAAGAGPAMLAAWRESDQ